MADEKTTALTAITSLTGDEVFYVVEDADGTPLSRKISSPDVATALADLAATGLFAIYEPDDPDYDGAVVPPNGAHFGIVQLEGVYIYEGDGTTDVADFLSGETPIATIFFFPFGTEAVLTTTNQNVDGVKTFVNDPIIPDEAYGAGWNGVLEPPTKNAVYDKIEAADDIVAGVRTTPNTSVSGEIGIDVVLSGGISGGDTLIGGTQDGDDLTLGSTTSPTRGNIILRDRSFLLTENITSTATTGLVTGLWMGNGINITLNSAAAFGAGNQVAALLFNPTVIYDLDGYLLSASALFYNNATFRNVAGEARSIGGIYAFQNAPTYHGDGAAVTGIHVGFNDGPTYSIANAGTFTAATNHSVVSGLAVGTGTTVTTRTGFNFADAAGAGSVGTQVGVEIAPLAKATTNIGIRNASTTVNTPLANTNITAVSGTIRKDASEVTLTANASYVLTSAPTIADGVQGQELKIINVDTADTITLQDQGTLASSNMRLLHGATAVALRPNESIEFAYNTTIADWVQTGGKLGTWQMIDRDTVVVTSGDISLAATAVTDITAFDLTLQGAVAGDVVNVYPSWRMEAVAQFVGFDIYTMVSGTPTNPFGGGLSASLGSTNGITGWFCSAQANSLPVTGQATRTLVSGDIVSGAVTIRLRYAKTTSTARKLLASTNDVARLSAELWRPPT